MPDNSRPKLPFQFKLYVWIYLLFIAVLPIMIVIGKAEKYPWLLSYFWYAAVWPLAASIIYWYTSRRCSSQQLRFFEGLVYITIAMNIGWVAMSIFTGFFGVLTALFIAPFAALYGDYRLEQEFAGRFFHKMVLKFYKRGLYSGEKMKEQTASAKPKTNLNKGDLVLKTIESPDGKERVLIVQRPDNSYSYRRQWLHNAERIDPDSPTGTEYKMEGEWGPPGPYSGIYDSTETAENEACGRVPWLKEKTIH